MIPLTPGERVVVEAAIRWAASVQAMRAEGFHAELSDAVDALRAERADPDAPQERDLSWGQVVEGDQIYSDKTKRWYEVTRAVHSGGTEGKSLINAKGIPRGLKPNSADPVKVRRGPTGNAVDMFASVLWSA